MPSFHRLSSKLFESYTIPLTVTDGIMCQFHCGNKIAWMSLWTMFSNNETSGQKVSFFLDVVKWSGNYVYHRPRVATIHNTAKISNATERQSLSNCRCLNKGEIWHMKAFWFLCRHEKGEKRWRVTQNNMQTLITHINTWLPQMTTKHTDKISKIF